MKRRDFGFLAGASVVAATATSTLAAAQSATPNPTLLTTTLTPLGGERAGNADGSIPAWTGGMVAEQNGPMDTPEVWATNVPTRVLTDEKPYLIIDASNMAQYQDMLTVGTQALMQKLGYSIKVYPTHRTASAPQYVYDFTAKNAVNCKLDPRGGRFGFNDGYGGLPFPIINTSDPLVAGAQLIWNHLTPWVGFCYETQMSQGFVMTNGVPLLTDGVHARVKCGFYDPKGSLETYDGYMSKLHASYKRPAASVGQEQIIWTSSNPTKAPDNIWELLVGQGRVRRAPNEQFDTPNADTNGVTNADEGQGFNGNPIQYDWKYIGKKEMFVPYNTNDIYFSTPEEFLSPKFPNPDLVRWEKHRVWVVEATLHPGFRNVVAKRRFYFDEDTFIILLGEGYDTDGNLWKYYYNYVQVNPNMPGVAPQGAGILNLQTGDYTWQGVLQEPPLTGPTSFAVTADTVYDVQLLAANASF